MLDETNCIKCGEAFEFTRRHLGYRTCLWCGEEAATRARESWCVIQAYNKGGYQYVTQESAGLTLRQINPKNAKGGLVDEYA